MALGGDRGLGVGPPWRLTWAGPWESREEAGFSSVWDTGRPRRQQCPPGLHSRGQPAEGPGLTLEAPPSPGSGGREWASGRGGGASIPWLPWESPHTLQPQTTLISTGQFWRTEAQTGHTVPGRSGLWRSSHSLASGPFLSGPCTRRPGAPAPSDALSCLPRPVTRSTGALGILRGGLVDHSGPGGPRREGTVPRQQVLASGFCGHRASLLLPWSPVCRGGGYQLVPCHHGGFYQRRESGKGGWGQAGGAAGGGQPGLSAGHTRARPGGPGRRDRAPPRCLAAPDTQLT